VKVYEFLGGLSDVSLIFCVEIKQKIQKHFISKDNMVIQIFEKVILSSSSSFHQGPGHMPQMHLNL
jgi:hypothetical protein